LTDQTEGFCGSVIGTNFYKAAVAAKKTVYTNSQCHTLDRDNLLAQKDSCGVGLKDERWKLAAESIFNVTHWPYI
jgi:hypothetical protein